MKPNESYFFDYNTCISKLQELFPKGKHEFKVENVGEKVKQTTSFTFTEKENDNIVIENTLENYKFILDNAKLQDIQTILYHAIYRTNDPM